MSLFISGEAHTGFESIVSVFKNIQPIDQLGGAALSVYFQGEKVVDLWTGLARVGQDWQADTLALSYSTGKGVLATLIHRLVDQGKLDYDLPMMHYWPEFGAHSQYHPTLRQVLCHESGLYDIRHVIQSAAVMLDWQKMLTAYAQATPRFQPGTDVAYQAFSFGWLLGGLIEKVMHEPLAVTLQRELVTPLDLDGAYFGVPESELSRVAIPFRPFKKVKPRPVSDPSAPTNRMRPLNLTEQLLQLTGQDPYDTDDALKPHKVSQLDFYSKRCLSACIPAATGVFTARALAKMYAMLAANGQWQGQQYLQHSTINQLSEIQSTKRDRVMPIPMYWRLGYHRVLTLGKNASQGFGHMGYNGSGAWCEPSRDLSFAYTHSHAGGSLATDHRHLWLTQRVLQLADKQLKGRAGWFG